MTRSRAFALGLAPLISILALWAWAILAVGLGGKIGHDLGKDDSDYIGAAQVLHRGDNPYRWQAVWEEKRRLVGLSEATKGKELSRVAEPPVMIWAMEPLAGKPLAPAALALEIIYLCAAIAGLLALLRAFGWRRPVLAALVGLALPPTTDYVFFGNVGIVVFAALGIGYWLARRYPALAGCVLAVSVCKPQVALPLAGLVVLFHSRSRKSAVAGFAAGTAAILASSAVVAGPMSLLWWLQSLHSFVGTVSTQPLLASLAVLYQPYVSSRVGLIIAIALVIPAAAATLISLRRYWHVPAVSVRELAWLWILWFVVAPYGHFYDYVFLAPVVLALLSNARPGDRVRALIVLYAVTLAGPIQTVAPQHIVAPVLLFVVAMACVLPWPGNGYRGVRDTEPVESYVSSA